MHQYCGVGNYFRVTSLRGTYCTDCTGVCFRQLQVHVEIMKTIIVVSLLLLNIHLAMSATKGVTASLKAKWSMTPFLLETRYATVEMHLEFNVKDMINPPKCNLYPLIIDCCSKRNVRECH